MTNVEMLLRAAAVVAAVAVMAGPYLVAKVRGLSTSGWKKDAVPGVDDAHVVLEIAKRLQTAGNKRGVELCQQLIDVMLQPAEVKAP